MASMHLTLLRSLGKPKGNDLLTFDCSRKKNSQRSYYTSYNLEAKVIDRIDIPLSRLNYYACMTINNERMKQVMIQSLPNLPRFQQHPKVKHTNI